MFLFNVLLLAVLRYVLGRCNNIYCVLTESVRYGVRWFGVVGLSMALSECVLLCGFRSMDAAISDIKLDTYIYYFMMHGTINLKFINFCSHSIILKCLLKVNF
jgi:hypothetical protein